MRKFVLFGDPTGWRLVSPGAILLLASLLLAIPAPLAAQNHQIKFEHLTVENGLSQNTVRSIVQDHQGFMWFGTDDGLNKFDGYRFTHYKNLLGDSSSLSNNTVHVIYEDKSGTLWIGTEGGLNRFDRSTETFRHFRHDPDDPQSLHDNIVSAIYEDAAGTLWIGTQWGLNKMDRSRPGQETFTRYQHRFDEYDRPWMQWVQGIGEYTGTQDSVLFVGSWGTGLLRFDRKTATYSRCYFPDVDPDSTGRSWINAIHVDHAGDVWVADAQIHKYDPLTGLFQTVYRVDLGNNKAHAHRVYNSASGQLLIGSAELGLAILEREQAIMATLRHDPDDAASLGDDWVEAIYQDRAGEMWIGTERGGISKYDPAGKRFAAYRFHPQERSQFSEDNLVATITTASGAVLVVGRISGLHIFDRSRSAFVPYRHDFRDAPHLRQILSRSVFEDSDGRIWFGSWGLGVYVYSSDDPAAELLHHFTANPDDAASLIDNSAGAICESREGEMWIGTPLGISVIRLDSLEHGRFTHYRHDPDDSTSLGDMRANVIFQDKDGHIWIGSYGGGLSMFDCEAEAFIRYRHDPYDANSLSSNRVLSIFQDSRHRLWIGTWGGLDRFDPGTQSFIHYTEADGLPNAEINGIVEDANANLWISTNIGISLFNPALGSFKDFGVYDGLLGRRFHAGAICKSLRTGEIFVGGPLGLTVFHPDSITDNAYIPPIVITSFKRYHVDHEQTIEIEEKGISTHERIELSYKDDIITFEFAALNFRNAAKNQYAYKLQGFNDDWIQLGTKREITFTNLDPGEYLLQVRGANNDGVWNEAGTSLEIVIAPPWWRTWWAYALYAALTLTILYSMRRYEMSRQQLKHNLELEHVHAEKLEELDHLKSRFFANISHEFRTPLTLILGPIANLQRNVTSQTAQRELSMMQRNGKRLLRLINQLLDLSRLEAGKLTLQANQGNVVPFVKGIFYSFESLAVRKKITMRFEADREEVMLYFDRDKLEKIVTNLLSNAFKFTAEAGEIAVTVTINEKFVKISVKDTGTGIPIDRLEHVFDRFYTRADDLSKEHEGIGIGLALTKELVELHHGEISVASEAGKGAEFTVCLPLGKDHLTEDEFVEMGKEQGAIGLRVKTPLPQPSNNPAIQPSIDPAIQPQATSNQIILIIEDNPDMRAYIREQLRDLFQVKEAEDGEEGIEKAVDTIPDLIISDVMMPKMDGYQLCARLKTDERTSHIPIVLLTAKSSGESKIEGLEHGADDYLIKPFDSHELLARVRNLIEQRRRLRERFGKEIKLQPRDIAITSADEKFLERAMAVVEAHISEADFDVETFGWKVGMSRKHLHRKLKALTNQAPREFIRTLRLQRAARLLEQHAGNVTEVAYEVGFNSLSHFAKAFKEQFGVLPKDFAGPKK